LLGQKSALFSAVFDGTTDAVEFDGQGSFMQNVSKLVEPLEGAIETGIALEDDANLDVVLAPVDVGGRASADLEVPTSAGIAAEGTATKVIPPLDLSGLTIERRPDGGLRIEASPALAGPLADLLESLARSLREGAGPAAE
jgi:hypothetical protein